MVVELPDLRTAEQGRSVRSPSLRKSEWGRASGGTPVIVLYGASGYTGRLAAAELSARGADLVVAGRNRARLEAVASDLPSEVEIRTCDAADPDGLAAVLAGADVVVSTVGPFERLGMPVVDAAVAAGVAYCDSTGEPGFMRRVAARHRDAPVPLVPACGFDYVPHDLAATVAADSLGSVDLIETVLATQGFATTRGTKASAVGALAGPMEVWCGGAWLPERPARHRRRFDMAAAGGAAAVAGISYPGGDPVCIAAHTGARTVRSFMAVPRSMAPVAGLLAPAGLALASIPFVRRRIDALVERAPEGPTAAKRAENTWAVMAEATGGSGTRAALASGTDTYGVTARFLALLAARLQGWRAAGIEPGFRGPAELVDDPFGFADEAGFELSSGPLR